MNIICSGCGMADWNDYYKNSPDAQLQFPSETLVRLFARETRPLKGLSALEVGCGSGNNIGMMDKLGLNVWGVEISREICNLTWEAHPEVIAVTPGTNTKTGMVENTFDYLVSWNCLHYETNEKDIKAAIKEYARVLKPGGRLFLSTTGYGHPVRRTARHISGLKHEICLAGDMRKGDVQCFFEDEELDKYLSAEFEDVMVGRTTSYLFTENLDWLIATAVKP